MWKIITSFKVVKNLFQADLKAGATGYLERTLKRFHETQLKVRLEERKQVLKPTLNHVMSKSDTGSISTLLRREYKTL